MNETQNESQSELLSRIDLIESMVREGRRGTENWGWVFVLWGAAYLIAIGWSYTSAATAWAWPVTMIAAGILTVAIATRKKRAQRSHVALARAIGGIWTGMGISIFIFCFTVGYGSHSVSQAYIAAILSFVGGANCASSIALRWRVQFAVALLWWASAAAISFVAERWIVPIVLIDAFVGFLCFGIYLMARERRERRERESHA